MNAKIIATKILSWLILIIGVLCLFSGIKGTIELSRISKEYETTDGYFCDYEIYSKGGYNAVRRIHINDTYRLIYIYQVEGQEYKVSTDMGFGMVPEYGSIKKILYNPDNPGDAFISGPNSNIFKIFFGLFFIVIPSFFIWLLKPEKKKAKKREKKTSIDGVGVAIGFAFMFFSYGALYFISGEFSIIGIINFYRKSFIIPMIIPIILIAAGGYLFVISLFFNRNRTVHTTRTEEAKYKVRNIIVCAFVIILFLGLTIRGNFFNSNANRLPKENVKQTDKAIIGKVSFTDVHTILSERGFETANIATTYWFYDENKLKNVVSGIKEDMAFEFYEYTDGETTDGVYNRISYDISQDMEQSEREKHETRLQGGGKMFTLTEGGVNSVVIYKNNTVIYANSPETESEIRDILAELGYL